MKSIRTVDSPSNPLESTAHGVIGGGAAPPLDLDGGQWIGRGWKRDCYLHPKDAGLCIKVANNNAADARKLRERMTSWFRAESAADAHNRREWQAYGAFGAVLAPFVPRYHGFIATSRGPGLVVDLVRDEDGRPSMQLRDWLDQGSAERGAALLDRFRVLFDLLAVHDLWLMDLNFKNFLVQVAEDGTERPRLIDLKRLADNKEMFQLAGLSRGLKRRKLARRIDRFQAKFKAWLGG